MTYPLLNSTATVDSHPQAHNDIVNVKVHFGAKGDGVTDDTTAVSAAIDAAEARGEWNIVYFPSGVYKIPAGIALTGKSVQLRGDGGGFNGAATYSGTVIYTSTATGPSIDFTGWDPPDAERGGVMHGGFVIRGSGSAAATGNIGLKLRATVHARFQDITIIETGGPCMTMDTDSDFNFFENCTFGEPYNASPSDIPYVRMTGPANGNTFVHCGMRSVTNAASVGVSGAWILESGATYPCQMNRFYSCWTEDLWVPTNGTIWNFGSNLTTFADGQDFDSHKVPAATNTSWMKLSIPSEDPYGGNHIQGFIQGDGGSGADYLYGIEVQSSRNRITGVKGYNGNNVHLASGTVNNYIELGGAFSSGSVVAVVDDSGSLTNIYHDHYLRTGRVGQYDYDDGGANEGPRYMNTANHASGWVNLGNAGVGVGAAAGGLYARSSANGSAVYVQHGSNHTSGTFLDQTGPALLLNPGSAQPALKFATGWIETTEISDPGVGGANTARVYAKDNGAGKTQLVVVFQSGAVQVLATEP